jgi:hypothetical protein
LPRPSGESLAHSPKVGSKRLCSSMSGACPHVALGRNEDGK